jgi:hypothetical protein
MNLEFKVSLGSLVDGHRPGVSYSGGREWPGGFSSSPQALPSPSSPQHSRAVESLGLTTFRVVDTAQKAKRAGIPASLGTEHAGLATAARVTLTSGLTTSRLCRSENLSRSKPQWLAPPSVTWTSACQLVDVS